MEILAVTLRNFKSHSDRQFSFQPGTNAICGENGAGKTSILEGIAWVLFNHRGVYKNEDLIRNGSGSAQVTVSFISQRDGRTYEVQRCTTKGYTIFDPQLNIRLDYKHIEDEVMPWLRQQLGVAPGTDLARLFANTIGVPQGTFTADFLQSPDKRKQIFDAILKVEEYRQTNQLLLSLEKYGKAEVETLERTIAQQEETLRDWDRLHDRRQSLEQEITSNETTLQTLQAQLVVLQAEKTELAAQAQQMQQLAAQLHQMTAQIEAKQKTVVLLQQSVARSQRAVELCTLNRPCYQGYLAAEAALKQFDQQVKQRHTLWQQRELQQKQAMQHQQRLTRLELQLETLTKVATELEALQPLITQQVELEQQQTEAIEQLHQFQALKLERQNLSRQLERSQANLSQQRQIIEQIAAHQSEVEQIETLEKKRDRCQEQLSRVEAAKQFEAELRHLVTLGESQRDQHQVQVEAAIGILHQIQQTVPLLANTSVESAMIAVQAGVELNTELLNALWRILSDLSEQTSPTKLQQQLQQVNQYLTTAYQYRADLAALAARQTQYDQQQTEINQLQARMAELQTTLAAEADWQTHRSQLLHQLQQLDNPRGQAQLLERNLQQQAGLQEQYTMTCGQYAALEQTLSDLEAQLQVFTDLNTEIEQQQHLRQMHQEGYLTYIQHQQAANQLVPLEKELQAALAELQTLEADRLAVETEQNQRLQTYDPERWQRVETACQATQTEADQLAGGLPAQRKLLFELDSQLELLQAVARKCDRAKLDLKQAEKVRKFITFARKVYKEAGPRITERYVQAVSREADRLFRELLNRANVALEWTREYEIVVQEGAHTRRLVNLSGGEQMCAALAVRLALLRILADIDIAFFDEPTTNMDRPRRQSLAEAIGNIKTFRQLFVISHDDTFEQVTENIILVEREA